MTKSKPAAELKKNRIKNCPFCGYPPRTSTNTMGASGDSYVVCTKKSHKELYVVVRASSMKQAITIWNRRRSKR